MNLATFNAVCNSLSALCLCAGYLAIRRGRRDLHKRLMLGALFCSLCFLGGYLTRIALHGTTRYPHQDWTRTLYLTILGTHTVLAAVNVPLVIVTLLRAWKKRFDRHKRIARWTLPIWLYVSVTGVVVYLMLYRL